MHSLLEDIDVTMQVDNEALYEICFDIERPAVINFKCLIGEIISCWAASFVSDSAFNVDTPETQTNLMPYPRTSVCSSFSALEVSAEKAYHDQTPAVVFGGDLAKGAACMILESAEMRAMCSLGSSLAFCRLYSSALAIDSRFDARNKLCLAESPLVETVVGFVC